MVISAIDQGKSREGGSEVPGSAYIHSFIQEVFIEHLLRAWGGNSKSDVWSQYSAGAPHGVNLH